MEDLHIQIYSSYDGWYIQCLHKDSGDLKYSWSWGHEDYEAGVGGEKLFGDLLKALGYSVYMEDSI